MKSQKRKIVEQNKPMHIECTVFGIPRNGDRDARGIERHFKARPAAYGKTDAQIDNKIGVQLPKA